MGMIAMITKATPQALVCRSYERLPSPGRSELGATKNHLEAAQVYGMVRCAWGLETVGLEAVKSDTSDIAETRNSFWRPRIQT